MINFLRKSRRKLADNNQFLQYSRYAIGEIVLVVIGILIALQFNEWNEQRKVNSIEQLLLKDLQQEVISNIEELQLTINSHENSLNAAIELDRLRQMPKERQNLPDSTIFNLFKKMTYNWTYNPKRGCLNSVLSSGQINYISNSKLKYMFTSLDDLTADASESSASIEERRGPLITAIVKNSFVLDANDELLLDPKLIFGIPEFVYASRSLFHGTRTQGLIEEKGLLADLNKIVELIDAELK